MGDDAISRQAAIDELKTRRDSAKDWYDKASADGDEMIIARADSAMMSFIESILYRIYFDNEEVAVRTATEEGEVD